MRGGDSPWVNQWSEGAPVWDLARARWVERTNPSVGDWVLVDQVTFQALAEVMPSIDQNGNRRWFWSILAFESDPWQEPQKSRRDAQDMAVQILEAFSLAVTAVLEDGNE